MDQQLFGDSPSGQIIQTLNGYSAFVPNPLPPTIEMDAALVRLLSDADRSLGTLAGVGEILPNPHLLIGPFVRKEAVSSSRIEGTQASLSDLFHFEATPQLKPRTGDVQEVRNYVMALEHGMEQLQELPVSLRLVRSIHAKLMEWVRGEQLTPGEFRARQNWIGSPGCDVKDATYVPPPHSEMMNCLDQWEKYLHSGSTLPPLIDLALIHYQFEAIHPFLDGNGRIGRLLITLLLCERGHLPQPLLYVSTFFEKHRPDYYDRLLAVSQRGAWTEWVAFFLQAITNQSREATKMAQQLLALQQEYRELVQVARASAILPALVDHLFDSPVLTVKRVQHFFDITYVPAAKALRQLEERGIVREVTGRKRDKVYVAERLLELIS